MLSSKSSLEENRTSRPPALVDIDGPINPSGRKPVGIGFSQYLVEKSHSEVTDEEISIEFEYGGVTVESESGTDYTWEDVKTKLQEENSYFDPEALEYMGAVWEDSEAGDYQSKVAEVTGYWMMGLMDQRKGDIETLAESYIKDELSPEIPRPVNNVIGMLQRDYNVFLLTANPQEPSEPLGDMIFGGRNGHHKVYGTVVADRDDTYIPFFERNMAEGKDSVLTEIPNLDDPRALAMGDMEMDYTIYSPVRNVFHIDPQRETSENEIIQALQEDVEEDRGALSGVNGLLGKVTGDKSEKKVFILQDITELKNALESEEDNSIKTALNM